MDYKYDILWQFLFWNWKIFSCNLSFTDNIYFIFGEKIVDFPCFSIDWKLKKAEKSFNFLLFVSSDNHLMNWYFKNRFVMNHWHKTVVKLSCSQHKNHAAYALYLLCKWSWNVLIKLQKNKMHTIFYELRNEKYLIKVEKI